VAAALNAMALPGVVFREAWFTPTFSKFAGQRCGGCQLHVTDRVAFRPVQTTLAILDEVRRRYGRALELHPDYFDRVMGTARVRQAWEREVPAAEISAAWQAELAAFAREREPFLLYD
jgi:uncharacterized protein YbbC (DUF1343 family)